MKCARYGLIAILLSIVVLPLSAMAVPLDGPIAPIMQDGLLFSNFSAELFKSPREPRAIYPPLRTYPRSTCRGSP